MKHNIIQNKWTDNDFNFKNKRVFISTLKWEENCTSIALICRRVSIHQHNYFYYQFTWNRCHIATKLLRLISYIDFKISETNMHGLFCVVLTSVSTILPLLILVSVSSMFKFQFLNQIQVKCTKVREEILSSIKVGFKYFIFKICLLSSIDLCFPF